MNTTLAKQVFTTVTATKLDTHGALPSMIVSTATPDRDSDRVLPEGADFRNFLKNPVLCWGHSHADLPIGTVTQLAADASGVRMQWKWLQNDAFADRVRNAYDQGVVRAASIGFIPRRSVRNEYGGLDHREWELVEISLVPVPANPQAVQTLKSLGLWGNDARDQDNAIDLDAIFRSAQPEVDLASIFRSREETLNLDPRVVDRVIADVVPPLVATALGTLAAETARRVMCRMTGRLD